jgi:hypothetical protein
MLQIPTLWFNHRPHLPILYLLTDQNICAVENILLRRQIIKEIKLFILLLKQGAPLSELEEKREQIRDMKLTLEIQDALDRKLPSQGKP